MLLLLAVMTNDHVGGDFNQPLCRTQTSRRPASDLGSRSLVGVWGSHDQMSSSDLQMMEIIALEINSIRKYDYDDAIVSNMKRDSSIHVDMDDADELSDSELQLGGTEVLIPRQNFALCFGCRPALGVSAST